MIVLLLPLVVAILSCYYWHVPVDLLRATDVPYLDTLRTYAMVVGDYPSPREKTERYTAEVIAIIDSTRAYAHARGKVYLYLRRDSLSSTLAPGDTLLVRTRIRRGGILGDFDYGEYLRLQGIVGQAFAHSGQWRLAGRAAREGLGGPVQWQHALVERYKRFGLEGAELGTIAALTLGYKEDLDDGRRQQFQKAGAAHILAVSGLHTGILYSIVWVVLTLGGMAKPLYEQRVWRCGLSAVIIAAMWGYAAMTGMTPSVVRSVVMLTLYEVGRMLYRQSFSLNTLAAAAWWILIVRPTDLFSVSFQLSFAAVAGILFLSQPFGQLMPTHRIRPRWAQWIARYVAGIISVSLAAQIATLPLSLYYFGQSANYFLLTNLLVIPLAWLIVVTALGVLALGGLPVVGEGIVWLCRTLTEILHAGVGWIEGLPGAVSELRVSAVMVWLLYGAIASAYLALRRSLWWLCATGVCFGLFCLLYTVV